MWHQRVKKHQKYNIYVMTSKFTNKNFFDISNADIYIIDIIYFLFISKYEWNLLLSESMSQIEYIKYFSKQIRVPRMTIISYELNDSDL